MIQPHLPIRLPCYDFTPVIDFALDGSLQMVGSPALGPINSHGVLRKEVIQPHLPIRLPCYDFTPVIDFALDGSLQMVGSPALGPINSHGVTGGVYKTRERIHRDILIRDY